MNGFADHGLSEDAFGEKTSLSSGLRTFDAFPKTKPNYTTATSRGGKWTICIFAACIFLAFSEFLSWIRGSESHHFSVEKGISHVMQLNLDIVVAMPCRDLHVNVQDASGDRILAGDLLTKADTTWAAWTDKKKKRRQYQTLHAEDTGRRSQEEEDTHVGHVLGHMNEGSRKFPKTPKLRKHEIPNSCRIFGSLEGNKVQGDFHITARGHGYMELGEHVPHETFNFSHLINELSFGPHYPNLLNPLDKTTSTTPANFFKYQYYLSIVPTVYTRSSKLTADNIPAAPSSLNPRDSSTIFTNQYAATSQSHLVGTNYIPGIFFKYDIEPILLIVSERRGSFLGMLVRIVNVISGVVVGGGWIFQLSEWAVEVWGRRRKGTDGVLHGRHASLD